jgi:mono/diheme cytochrome c family protein
MCTRLLLMLVFIMLISACTGNSQAGESAQENGGQGEQLFVVNCSACHGVGGVGIQGLGKPLTTSEFVGQLSDQELLDFIKTGRSADDPLNTSGVLMPPKGGNMALTDEELMDIVAYIRSIHQGN